MRCRRGCLGKVLVLLSFCILAACTPIRKWTSSVSGRPYEVIVVGDREHIVSTVLSQPLAGLPQEEPMFDVSSVDSAVFSGAFRLARNVVTVRINSHFPSHTRLFMVRQDDVPGQCVISVEAPTVNILRRESARWGSKLMVMLNAIECRREIDRTEHERNHEMERRVKREMGIELHIPADMTSYKSGKDMMWISNNSATAMQNIVIYKTPKVQSAVARVRLRDSVMKVNIHGETDDMYVTTVSKSVQMSRIRGKENPIIVLRGLWQMVGDRMGGPFVSHSIGNITVESFVYAPGKKKRNLLRQGEAVLYTLKTTNNGQQ